LVILDGMADRPASELAGKTPLEAADTPNLNRLVAAGENGIMDVGPPGTPLSSDLAHTYLFGYTPTELPGRSVLEARGFDRTPGDDAVVCSACFATVIDEAGGREPSCEPAGAPRVVGDRHLRDLSADYTELGECVAHFEHEYADVSFTYTWKNRGIVLLKPVAGSLSAAVTDTDPFETGLPVVRSEATEDTEDRGAAGRTADALAEYTRWTADRLRESPVDVVLSKWAGQPTGPESFGRRHGLDAVSLTPKPVLTGLAKTLSMAHQSVDADYDRRSTQILDILDEFEFIHAHYPEPDEVAHAAGPEAKCDELARIDRSLKPLVERALSDPELVTVITSDHTTPSTEDVVHSGAPVPVTVVAESVRTDDVEIAGERPAACGGMGRIDGRDLLRVCRAAADRVMLDGLRRSPAVRDYPHRDVTPLRFDEEGSTT
jgi:2,3-bisphosphoglycerate-independent phosphoglycerate mutase